MKTKEFRSEFDNDVIVNIIDNNDFRYSVVKPLFESYGFGFMIPANISEKLMLIDGEQKLNKHILKWIEAHEVAHFILGHGLTQNNSAEEEIEADRLAYQMLDGKGYTKSAQMVKDKFEERHGIKY